MRKKILHIIIKTRYDGVTSYAIRVIKALPKFDHHILSCYEGCAISEIEIMNINCEHLINDGRISYSSLLRKYFKSILFFIKNRFDIIHYHQGGIGVLLIAVIFRNKAQIIHHLHSGNLIGDNSKQDISFVHLNLLKFISRFTYQIAVADHVFSEYKSKVRLIKNLKLLKNCVPYYFKKKELRKNSIGYIGRFTKEKGFQVFLSASEQINMVQPQLNIIAIGETHINNKNIRFLPPSFNVENFYESIDLLLFISLATEGLPLVVLEAISFDVGVIAYPLKGVIEILGEDYPLLVKNESEVILKIDYFYSDKFDRQKLSEIHKERNDLFNFDKMINGLKLIYE
jgi:glycosyltransferase involved in cell wall biosynthesis